MELILQGIDSGHNSESQDNDQPDYDSVASDEDPAQETMCSDSCNDGRTKVNYSKPAYLSNITCAAFPLLSSSLARVAST